MSTTKKATVLRDFRDAGTEQQFTVGQTIDLSEGALANYAAAGLVEAGASSKPSDDGKDGAKKV